MVSKCRLIFTDIILRYICIYIFVYVFLLGYCCFLGPDGALYSGCTGSDCDERVGHHIGADVGARTGS